MPKLNLKTASRIKNASGEIVALKAAGFSWIKPAPIGTPSFQTSDLGPYFRDPDALGARSVVTMSATLLMDADQTDNTVYLVGATAGTFAMQAIKSNGAIRMTVRADGAATTTNIDSAANAFTLGAQVKVVSCIDLVAGTMKAWADDVLIVDGTFAVATQFQTARNVLMLDKANGLQQFKGSVERLAVWFAATTDGVEPVSAPYKEITGNAATVNADAWKLGADAT
tara:strand:+ start:30425 stop:31102 length:678 start_codon:yes stop_codon:yes gene_type:complete